MSAMAERRPVKDTDINLAYAARPRKPWTGAGDTMRAAHYLHMTKPRPPLAPEPVDTSQVLGRPPQEWETYLIIEARQQERTRELVLLAGLG